MTSTRHTTTAVTPETEELAVRYIHEWLERNGMLPDPAEWTVHVGSPVAAAPVEFISPQGRRRLRYVAVPLGQRDPHEILGIVACTADEVERTKGDVRKMAR
jgi:hypothetical protein